MSWIHFLFFLEGRISRADYWLSFVLPCIGFFIVVDAAVPPLDFNKIILPLALVALWSWIAVAAKRCHDRDRSGWFLLIVLVPVVGPYWLLIELGFFRGTVGANQFGPDPLRQISQH